jgi:hypothetical protein
VHACGGVPCCVHERGEECDEERACAGREGHRGREEEQGEPCGGVQAVYAGAERGGECGEGGGGEGLLGGVFGDGAAYLCWGHAEAAAAGVTDAYAVLGVAGAGGETQEEQ